MMIDDEGNKMGTAEGCTLPYLVLQAFQETENSDRELRYFYVRVKLLQMMREIIWELLKVLKPGKSCFFTKNVKSCVVSTQKIYKKELKGA